MSFSRTRARAGGDAGFTLVEMMVSLTLLALVASGLVPLLVATARADLLTRQQTQARSLSVARVAAMRSLPFHVDYQNGAYLDVLDEYYTNASTTPNTVAATGGTGYYGTGVVPGQTASGAYYRVDFAPPSLPAGFTQTVYSQFLAAASAVNSSRGILTPPSTYNSQAAAADAPPSPLLGVTVLTGYGGGHSFRTYTEIADTGHGTPLVVGQAGATALSVSSHAADGSLINALAAQVGLDGALSNTSSASANALASRIGRSAATGAVSYPDVVGASGSVASPPIPAATADQSAGVTSAPTASGCGWAVVGPTATSNVSASVGNAQPLAPTNVESGATPVPAVSASVRANGGSGTCGAFAFTNALTGSLNPALGLSSSSPQVLVPDSSGNGSILSASAYLDTPTLATGSPVRASASSGISNGIQLFPGMSFVTDATYGRALLVVQLTSSTISCASNASAATASYSGTVLVWTQPTPSGPGSYAATTFSYTGGAAPALPPLSTPVTYSSGTPVPLSTWIQSWQLGSVIQQAALSGSTASVGRHTIPGALTIDTQPTLLVTGGTSPDTGTDLLLNVGRVSCVSEDNR